MSRVEPRLAIHYGLTIFLSAFLLFQVQPLIGKMILPWFGGSAAVWTTCMLFFQSLLLLGYLYSHWIVRFLAPRGQSLLHGALLLACLLTLPLSPSADWRSAGGDEPTIRILLLLASTIGLPYLVLSTTGPLIQAWFAREQAGTVPYRLFALSNLGSLLALLAYPLVVEPLLPTRWQSWTWSGLFVAFALACGLLSWRGAQGQRPRAIRHDGGPAPGAGRHLAWVALAACPSILMVADTSFLTENIAPVPLLWVVPLSLYLLSFIFCFERRDWYRRQVFLPLLVCGLGAMAYLPTLGMNALPVFLAMGVNLVAFFVACMVCHGELARLQPHPAHLTGYYLMLALGGALGGLFVGVVAPLCFSSNYELSAGLVLTGLVAGLVVLRGHRFASARRRVLAWAGVLLAVLVIAGIRAVDHREDLEDALVSTRNFYGTLRVYSMGEGRDAYRSLMHGRIIHGRQFTDPARQDLATAYYGKDSGVGRMLRAKAAAGPLRVGVIGVGVGTLVSYGRPGDQYRLYDIDPQVLALARSHFTYLERTAAATETVLGDARLVLEREAPQEFDVLVVDAFSGDSVPIHLLTREAFATYFRHLKPGGVLAVHVTNRFLDLAPVVKAAAASLERQARLVVAPGDPDQLVYRSSWALVSADGALFSREELRDVAEEIPPKPGLGIWSDDYSSVFAVLK